MAVDGSEIPHPPEGGAARRRGRKKRKNVDERARIEVALKMLDEAKERAQQEKAEYGKFLVWKVKMQRKGWNQKKKEEEEQRAHTEERLRAVLSQHRKQKVAEQKQWTSYAKSTVRLRPPPPLETPTLGEIRWMEMKQERANRWRARQQTLVPHPPPNAQQSALDSPGRGTGKEIFPAPVPAPIGISDKITYDDFYKLATDQEEPSEMPKGCAVFDETKRIKFRHKLQERKALMQTMQTYAIARRQAALERLLRDPPADYVLTDDLRRYIPVELLEEDDFLIEDRPKHQRELAKRDDFFLTEVDESNTVTKPPSKRTVVHKRWNWLEAFPLGVPPLPPPVEEDRKRRQQREKEELAEYLHSVSKGYVRVANRTEHHGRTYNWQRQEKHALPIAPHRTLALTAPPPPVGRV